MAPRNNDLGVGNGDDEYDNDLAEFQEEEVRAPARRARERKGEPRGERSGERSGELRERES
jgi:hypothetical protein